MCPIFPRSVRPPFGTIEHPGGAMFRTSMLAREESRIFEVLLSRFDSLGDEQMLAVGSTPALRRWRIRL
jgi:hypothetical protein